jgi:hypothetical protein
MTASRDASILLFYLFYLFIFIFHYFDIYTFHIRSDVFLLPAT